MLERAPSRTRRRAGFPARDVAALAELVRARVARKRARPLLVGLTGLPGSGKSTLAAQLASELRAGGIATLVLALDDFYLGRAARAKLARHVHPLFATRGPAGTHDIECLAALLDAAASGGELVLPRFDRLADRRLPPSRWRRLDARVDVLIVEGWLVGVPPLDRHALARSPNALERLEDEEHSWRLAVNRALAGPYARTWKRLDLLIALLAPDLDAMRRWRAAAERAMAAKRNAAGMTRAGLDRFLQHYERWAAHALRTLPGIADVVWRLDRRHRPVRCVPTDNRAGTRR